ncbi:MAG: hypothetical protein RL305_784, partial [Pseudomonadota bacterium]
MITHRKNANELLKFAASGFKDFTRIAASSPEMWKDITLANKKFILEDIQLFENQIKLLKEAIEQEYGIPTTVLSVIAEKSFNEYNLKSISGFLDKSFKLDYKEWKKF